MGTIALFEAFDRRITPEKGDVDAALGRAIACATALSTHYYGTTEASDHITLIGSLVKHTAIAPIADVDLVFHMPAGTYAQYDAYNNNGQSGLLQDVRRVLQVRYPQTDIKGDGPVVVAGFASGATVEIVPGTLCDSDTILSVSCSVPVTIDGGRWEATNYGAHFDAFHLVDHRRSGQLARLMRYIKTWRRVQFAVIKSLTLELMAIEFFRHWDTAAARTGHVWDDWMIRDFLSFMIDNQDTAFPVPGSSKQITAGYGWRQDAATSLTNAQAACTLDQNSASYTTTWRKVLGNGFGN